MGKAVNLIHTKGIGREEWLGWRRKGIGGSDASAIVGLNPYSSAFQVWVDKLGLNPTDEDNEAMRQGRDFEDYVAKRFEEATGKKTRNCNFILQHSKHDILLANIDRMIVGEKAGLECKTTSVLNKTDFEGGDIPPQYYVQCQHYMAVTGYKKWYLAVLILNRAFYWFEIDRNEDDIKALVEAELDFWDKHIIPKVPPKPDGSDSANDVIKKLYPKGDGEKETIGLYSLENEMILCVDIKQQIKDLEKQQAEIEQQIKVEMKDATEGNSENYIVKWDNRIKTSVDSKLLKAEQPEIYEKYTKQTEYRAFSIKLKKGGK